MNRIYLVLVLLIGSFAPRISLAMEEKRYTPQELIEMAGGFTASDCSFTEEQLKTMTRGQFLRLDEKSKAELALLFIASSTDEAAGKLIDLLPDATCVEVQGYANNIPPVIFTSVGIEQKSVRREVLKITIKAIAEGFVKELPAQVVKQTLGVPF